jgi:hypothetical protein
MKTFICTISHSRQAYQEFMNRFEQKMLILSNKIF